MGPASGRLHGPLRTYARLEAGIAATALLYFVLLAAYRWICGPLYGLVGHRPVLFLLVKLVLSTVILFPPAFFMGGTLPVIGQYLVRQADRLGRTASLLHAINTIGAASGALAAGFFLPRLFGFRASYLMAMAMNLIIAAIAWSWAGGRVAPAPQGAGDESPAPSRSQVATLTPATIGILAALSGFLTLGLEVLWTRMFAQVLQNSVYTFAVILTVFLAALALGSVVANRLCRLSYPPESILAGLLVLCGLATALTPWIFYVLTDGLQPVGSGRGWTGCVVSVFGSAAAVLLVPGITIGSVFPYLMKLAEAHSSSAGRTIGQLAAINTVFAIFGSLAAGFFLLELLGLWNSLRAVGVAYLLLALLIPRKATPGRLTLRVAASLGAVVFAFVVTYADLADVLVSGENERTLELREGSQGAVAVVERDGDLLIKVNNSYRLGTRKSARNLRVQTWLPLGLHPRPHSVFFLGMGTGITAGAALALPVERVVVCELNPDVVDVSREYFEPQLLGLFNDPRAEVLVEDGRNFLYATDETFDVIIGDIFLSYRAGVGSLYTIEHFRSVRERLEPGGVFVQWLPSFDMSFEEVAIVTRTMLEVFPQVTLWRRSVSPRFPVIGLMARTNDAPLDPDRLERHLDALVQAGMLRQDNWLRNIPLAALDGQRSPGASAVRGRADQHGRPHAARIPGADHQPQQSGQQDGRGPGVGRAGAVRRSLARRRSSRDRRLLAKGRSAPTTAGTGRAGLLSLRRRVAQRPRHGS